MNESEKEPNREHRLDSNWKDLIKANPDDAIEFFMPELAKEQHAAFKTFRPVHLHFDYKLTTALVRATNVDLSEFIAPWKIIFSIASCGFPPH